MGQFGSSQSNQTIGIKAAQAWLQLKDIDMTETALALANGALKRLQSLGSIHATRLAASFFITKLSLLSLQRKFSEASFVGEQVKELMGASPNLVEMVSCAD